MQGQTSAGSDCSDLGNGADLSNDSNHHISGHPINTDTHDRRLPVGIDCEWKDPTEYCAVLQIAAGSLAWVIDTSASRHSDPAYGRALLAFVMWFFSAKSLLRLGFGFHGDIQKIGCLLYTLSGLYGDNGCSGNGSLAAVSEGAAGNVGGTVCSSQGVTGAGFGALDTDAGVLPLLAAGRNGSNSSTNSNGSTPLLPSSSSNDVNRSTAARKELADATEGLWATTDIQHHSTAVLVPRLCAPYTPTAVPYREQSYYCRFMIGHTLGSMDIRFSLPSFRLLSSCRVTCVFFHTNTVKYWESCSN